MRMALHDIASPKRPVNVSMNADLVARLRAAGLSISALAEEATTAALARLAHERHMAEVQRGAELSAALVADWGDLAAAVRDADGAP
jgi:post-segregation antitoxin (ccd killing protein)